MDVQLLVLFFFFEGRVRRAITVAMYYIQYLCPAV